MKTIYTIPLLALLLMPFAGCQDPVKPGFTPEADLHTLSVKGMLNNNSQKEYPAKIDDEKGLITIQVPYYISDTEPVMGDLTQMRVIASMPLGAKFVPDIGGVRDLTKGFTSTIFYADGTKKEYKFVATSAKSSANDIAAISMIGKNNNKTRLIWRVSPEEEDGAYVVSVAQFGYKHLESLRSARLEVEPSPWSSVSANVSQGPVNVTDESFRFTITAQDGTPRTYRFKIVDPTYVPEGVPGSITPLFGVKVLQGDRYGWQKDQNRSMAVIGDELIIANLKEGLLRHNRFTGEPTGKTVNRTGITGQIHGIANDDAGHLVATTIASIGNKYIPDHLLEIFVWKDGIEGTPTKIYSMDLSTDPSMAGKNPNANTGRTIGIAGNILSGKARVGLIFGGLNEFLVLSFNNGAFAKNSGLIKPNATMSAGNATKCVPTGVEDTDPVVIGMTRDRTMLKVQMDGSANVFSAGASWWPTWSNTKGFAYTRFNGMELVAIGNGEVASWDGSLDWRNRLIVANIIDGSAGALTSREILDSYNPKYDPSQTGDLGEYTPQKAVNEDAARHASTAPYGRLYGWEVNRVGKNENKVGDACFSISSDGATVQVYLMATDMGFLGWEITKYAL